MIDKFHTYLSSEKRYSPLTIRNYIGDLNDFAKSLCGEGEFDPKSVTRNDIREWILMLGKYRNSRGQRLSAASINRRLSSIKSFYGWMTRKKHIATNPTIGVHRLKTSSLLPTFIAEEQLTQGLDNFALDNKENSQFLAKRNILIIYLLYGLGLRRAELIGINIDDISADKRTLKVRGKGGKERMIPIIDTVFRHIEDYLSERSIFSAPKICIKAEKALILSLKGERISESSIYNIVRKELGQMGVKGKLSPHVLRHTFATHIMNSGGDMRTLQELMGHASLRSTQVYTHNTISSLQRAYDRAHPRGAKQELKNRSRSSGRVKL